MATLVPLKCTVYQIDRILNNVESYPGYDKCTHKLSRGTEYRAIKFEWMDKESFPEPVIFDLELKVWIMKTQQERHLWAKQPKGKECLNIWK